ncbi:Na/Pi symporter [Terracidiphilus sp.]|jgi:phosphate:Na+ symporter|uniref:Na/Pi symporter n=1 Tax=Terracidiphilus sp. TaxID=1964191 RepID=UPI003C180A1B
MVKLIALYTAGLSFFFTGIAGISDNLRQLSGQRFRNLLTRTTSGQVRAGLLGIVAGAVTQSTSVVTFILSGMVSSGLLPLSRALVVLSCANIGTAALVLVAAVDLHLPILMLIGICGTILAFKLLGRWKPWIAGLLSIGLVFFGLDMMKQAFSPLAGSHGLMTAARFFDRWPDAAFVVGLLMRSVIHSSAGCAAIIITVEKVGLRTEFPALMAIAGLGLGAAVAMHFLTSTLRGIPRQIAWYQIFSNAIAAILLGALLLIERESSLPLLQAAFTKLSPTLPGQIALMFLTLNLTIAAVGIAGLKWAPKWLAKISPATPEQSLSQPMYLQPEALRSPEATPELVALEQMRIMLALRRYLDIVRGRESVTLKSLHDAAGVLEGEITSFLAALVKQPIATDLAARVISFQHKEETLRALDENVFLFAETLQHYAGNELAMTLLEALDTILLMANDALTTRDFVRIDLLVRVTDDRGSMMEEMRDRMYADYAEKTKEIAALHYATRLFERNIWLLRQLALWLRVDARMTA